MAYSKRKPPTSEPAPQTLAVYRRSELEAIDAGCLYRFREVWINGVDDASDPALIGIAFHKIMHTYITRLVETQVMQDAELAYEAFVAGTAAAQTPSRLLPEVRKVWEWYAERFELALDQFVAAEEKQTAEDGGDAVTFTPDLVTVNPVKNELEIHDFKSGWHPPLSEEELRGLFQARVYVRYAKERWPNFQTYRFTLHAVRFNVSVSVLFTETEMDEIDREVRAHIAAIERAKATDEWPAMPGPACRFCTLQCPVVDQQPLVPKRLTLPDQALQVASWLLAAEGQVKSVKKALKAYCAAHGAVNVNGVVFDHRKATQRLYPVGDVLEVLRLRNVLGAFTEEGLTLSHSALAKLFKRFPQLEEDLAPFVQTKDSYRFGAKDDGEE